MKVELKAKGPECRYRTAPVTGTLCEHCKEISDKAQFSHFRKDPKIK